MSNLHVGASWGPRTTSFDVLAQQSFDFARRLRLIHPLFSEISPRGNRSGYSGMLKEPLVADIEEADWIKMLEASQAKNVYFTSVTYWNRHPADDERCLYTIHANNTGSMGNGVVVNKVPEPLNKPDYLTAILKAQIEVFDADLGEVWTDWPGDVEDPIILFWHWLWWAREGQLWPPEHSRFNQAQGPHSSAEAWLDGMLYTWPEYEPWLQRPPRQQRI